MQGTDARYSHNTAPRGVAARCQLTGAPSCLCCPQHIPPTCGSQGASTKTQRTHVVWLPCFSRASRLAWSCPMTVASGGVAALVVIAEHPNAVRAACADQHYPDACALQRATGSIYSGTVIQRITFTMANRGRYYERQPTIPMVRATTAVQSCLQPYRAVLPYNSAVQCSATLQCSWNPAMYLAALLWQCTVPVAASLGVACGTVYNISWQATNTTPYRWSGGLYVSLQMSNV